MSPTEPTLCAAQIDLNLIFDHPQGFIDLRPVSDVFATNAAVTSLLGSLKAQRELVAFLLTEDNS